MKAGIVGAGIMGRVLAFELLQAGCDVTLFDTDNDNGRLSCSNAAAGLLTPLSELEKSDPLIYQMGLETVTQLLPTLLLQLNRSVYFQQNGSLLVSHPRDQKDLQRYVECIQQKVPTENCYSLLPSESFKHLEPELNHIQHAYHFPMEAHMDVQSFLHVLRDQLYENNVIWHQHTHIDHLAPHYVYYGNHKEKFDLVFDCRGMGAKTSFANLHAIRGELIWLYAPQVNIKRPVRFLHPRYGLYIVPREQSVYLVGATEIYTENYDTISVRSTLEMLTAAYYLHPGFAEARIIKTVTQCRPTLPDYLPKIKYTDGIMAINGLYRHGCLLAPALAAEVIRKLKGQVCSYPIVWEEWNDANHFQYTSNANKRMHYTS